MTPTPFETVLTEILDGFGRWMVDTYVENMKTQPVVGIAKEAINPTKAKQALLDAHHAALIGELKELLSDGAQFTHDYSEAEFRRIVNRRISTLSRQGRI